jgi:hypothetical protein
MGVEYSEQCAVDTEQKPMYEMSRKAFESRALRDEILNY